MNKFDKNTCYINRSFLFFPIKATTSHDTIKHSHVSHVFFFCGAKKYRTFCYCLKCLGLTYWNNLGSICAPNTCKCHFFFTPRSGWSWFSRSRQSSHQGHFAHFFPSNNTPSLLLTPLIGQAKPRTLHTPPHFNWRNAKYMLNLKIWRQPWCLISPTSHLLNTEKVDLYLLGVSIELSLIARGSLQHMASYLFPDVCNHLDNHPYQAW